MKWFGLPFLAALVLAILASMLLLGVALPLSSWSAR